MKVYSLEETLNLIHYYSETNWAYRLDVLLNTQIEDKEYDNDTINKFFTTIIGCIEKCFYHYKYESIGLQFFFISEMIHVLNKIKEKVKPLFDIEVIPQLYENDIIYIKVAVNDETKYYEFKMKKGFVSKKEEDFLHYLDLVDISNDKKINYIPLKEMEF